MWSVETVSAIQHPLPQGSEASPATIARAARKLSRDSRSANSGRASFDQDGFGPMLHVFTCIIIIILWLGVRDAPQKYKIQTLHLLNLLNLLWFLPPGIQRLEGKLWPLRGEEHEGNLCCSATFGAKELSQQHQGATPPGIGTAQPAPQTQGLRDQCLAQGHDVATDDLITYNPTHII